LRIAFFQRDLPSEKKGGVACQVHSLANAVCRAGHDVTVFTLSPRPEDALYKVRPVPMPQSWRKSRVARKFLLGVCFSKIPGEGFDVFHAHGDNYGLFRKHPQVRTYYGSALAEAFSAETPGRFLSQLLLWGLELAGTLVADKKTAISPGTKKYIPGIDAVAPCGVDLSRFRPGSEKSARPSLLFVGDIQGRKRGRFLLEQFARVRLAIPEAELWMVSPEATEGDGIRHFRDVTENELIALYQRAWVLCAPSTYEGFGLPLVEAMACGTPVLATPNDGSRFVLDNGRYGLMARDGGYAETLTSLLLDAGKRREWMAKGLDRARAFDLERTTTQYIGIYHELLARK
jgi:phosphatidylinositol alpha-mannosyltransferase